jgi:hypothetical protein
MTVFFGLCWYAQQKNPYNLKTNLCKYLHYFHVVVLLLLANSNNNKKLHFINDISQILVCYGWAEGWALINLNSCSLL